jgi:hypothetical protein
MKRKYLFLIAFTCTIVYACQKKPEVGGTTTQSMANEWWVQLFDPSGALVYPASYYGHIATYNTSSNTDEIWVDDQNEIWNFKVKAKADLNALTFTANKAVSVVDNYNIKVTITDGKIIPNVGHSKSGVLTDSIYMKIEFEDDPGTIYSLKGHARTRFAEDDYH